MDARSIGFAELATFDRRFFPAERDAFLALWITAPGRRAVAARRNGSVAGFAVRRPAGAVDRMRTGGVPQIDQDGIYAVTTLELG